MLVNLTGLKERGSELQLDLNSFYGGEVYLELNHI